MDFRLSSEQEMLRDGARRFVTSELDFESRMKRVAAGTDLWASLASMGWLMLVVPEEAGGLGSPIEDIAIVVEELGRGIAIEPFITAAFLPARLLSGKPVQHVMDLLEAFAAGDTRLAACLYEAPTRYALDGLQSRAVTHTEGYRLTGTKPLVFGGAEADHLIVAAAIDDDPQTALFLVSAHAPGISRRPYRTIDNVAVADISFDNVALGPETLLTDGESARSILAKALDETATLLCLDAVGCMDRAIEMTAEYLHVRKQFNQALASFQALQHGIANLFIDANEARSLAYRALAACGAEDPAARACAASASKYRVLETARRTTGQTVHFHGGIGITCEYPVGEYLRRMLVSEQIFGNGQYHLDRYLGMNS